MLTYLGDGAARRVRGDAGRRRGAPPWGNMFEFATASAAAVGLTYSVLAKRNHWQWLGVFVVTPILLVLGLSLAVLYTEAGELMPALKSYWLAIHVGVAFLAVAFFTIAAIIGVLYLVRRRRRGEAAGQAAASSSRCRRPPRSSGRPTPQHGGLHPLDLHPHRGGHLGEAGLGRLLAVGPEGGLDLRHLDRLRGLHARSGDRRDRPAQVDVHRLAGFVCVIINFTLVNLVSTFVGMHNYSGM